MSKFQIRKPNPKNMSFNSKPFIALLLLASLLLFGASGYYWYNSVLMNPDRIINGMLDKSLQTSSVYRTLDLEQDRSTVKQNDYVAFSPAPLAKSVTSLSETSEVGKTTVVTERIGTKSADYVRYTDIDVKGNNQPNDFSSVVGTWGKREADPQNGLSPTFLNELLDLFIVVPFGNLTNEQRTVLKNEISKVGLYKIENRQIDYINGRPVLSLKMNMKPQSLIQVIAKQAELTKKDSAGQLDPDAYADAPDIRVAMQIDVLSRHVRMIELAELNRRETYHGYNSPSQTQFPDKTISIDELQTRLQAVEPRQQ